MKQFIFISKNKGTAIVEAVIVYPLIIASVAAVLTITTGLYHSVLIQTTLHMELRRECGLTVETISREDQTAAFQAEKSSIGLRPVLTMEESKVYQLKPFFRNRVTKTESGRSYLIDEAELVRIKSLIMEKLL